MLRASEDGGGLHQVVESLEPPLGVLPALDPARDARAILADGLQAKLYVELRREEVPAPALVQVDLADDQHRLADVPAHQDVRFRCAHLPAGARREAAA